MLHKQRRLALAAAALCLFTACTPPTTPTPSPAPSNRCTPEAGGDEYDCTPGQYDEMLAKDKLYAEAEAVYRKFLAEEDRIFRAGGVVAATPILGETTMGAYLTDSLTAYKRLADRGVIARGGSPELVYFRRAPGRSKGGSVVSVTTCVDGTSLEFFRSGKSLGKGKVTRDDTYFGRADGTLKIIGADGSEVESCD